MSATDPAASRGKNAAVIAGFGLGLVGLVGVVLWKQFVVEYHLMALRQDPGLMGSWAASPADSPRGIALRRHLATARGLEALRRSFLDGSWRLLAKDYPELLPATLKEGQKMHMGLYDLPVVTSSRGTGTTRAKYFLIDGSTTVTFPVDPRTPLLALEPIFELLGSGEFQLDEYPGIRFHIWSYREDPEKESVTVEVLLSRPVGGSTF